MAKQIIIKIPLDGDVTVETKGYSGPECKQATRDLQAALGEVVSDKNTPEYYQNKANTKGDVKA